MNAYQKLLEAKEEIRKFTDFEPEIALVLGSGLGNYADKMKIVSKVFYKDIKGFPVSTVKGHDGAFIFGYIGDVKVVAMKGRVHYYEDYNMQDVVMPIRLMGLLGAKKLILTNAAGGVNLGFKPGDLMIITDHISAFVPSPLKGANLDELGTRFPDMSNVYNKELTQAIRETSKEINLPLQEGVYFQFQGPNYETPAEIRMIRALGGDAAGMSTACEAIAANHMGLKVCGITCITNMAAGILDQPLNHKEVQETANKVAKNFENLVTGLIAKIG